MTDQDAFDPERGLWRPGRRRFLFLSGAAMAGTLVPGWAMPRTIADDFRMDLQTISYVGPPAGVTYTLDEFMQWLVRNWDTEE